MASLRLRRGKWYSRVLWYNDTGKQKEKQIPLRTKSKTIARKRNSIVEKYEEDIKDGLTFDYPWLKDGGKITIKERSIGETLEEYYAVRNIEGIRKSTIDRTQVAIKSLYTLMSSSTSLDVFNEDFIERYKRHCRESLNHKPNTININLSKIRAFLNWCHRKKYIKDVPYIEMVRVEPSEIDYFSDDMLLQIMECHGLHNHYKRAFLFYLDTGCRLFEPFNGYIKGNTLVIPPNEAKTHRKRTVHLTSITLAIIQEMCERVDNCIGNKKFA